MGYHWQVDVKAFPNFFLENILPFSIARFFWKIFLTLQPERAKVFLYSVERHAIDEG